MDREQEGKNGSGGVWDKFLNIIGLESDASGSGQRTERGDYYEEDEENALDNPFITKGKKGKVVNIHQAAQDNVVVIQPQEYEDTQQIVDNIKRRKPVIINLDSLDTLLAQRILDFLSGAVYAVEGTIQKVARGIFVLTPSNINVTGNVPAEQQNNSFYTVENELDD
jgi:cell division inhibitor SepF